MFLLLSPMYLRDLYGISIALRSLSRSLSTRLIPAGAFKGWCAVRTLQEMVGRGLSIAVASHSLDSTLQMYKVQLREETKFSRKNLVSSKEVATWRSLLQTAELYKAVYGTQSVSTTVKTTSYAFIEKTT